MPRPSGRVPAPCIPDAKIGSYLLDLNHVEGGPKARFYLSHGFSVEDPRPLISALLKHVCDEYFVRAEKNVFVTKYIYEGMMPMPNGTSQMIRSVWKLTDDGFFMALVTAYRI